MNTSVGDIVARAEALHHDVELRSVRAWREAHGGARAVAHLPIYFPEELIDAAGMLPVALAGGGDHVEIIRGDAYFQSYICQIPRSTIELALAGHYDCIDGFIFPSICDVIRNLSGMWKLLFPDRYVRYFDVPQNFDDAVGGAFYRQELAHIRADLAALSGRAPDDDALRDAIRRYNRNRRAIAALMALRDAEPWTAPAWECYLVLRARDRLPVDEHTDLVSAYVAAARAAGRPLRDSSRVITIGSFCEQPPLGLIKTLELAGCHVVWDDMTLGSRWIEGEVAEDGDPLAALSDAFLHHSVTTAAKYQPDGRRGEHLVQLGKRTRAEGVIFAAPSFCDPALLDQPMLQHALDAAGVPWTAFKYAENLGQYQVIREQAGTFADSIKLWSDP